MMQPCFDMEHRVLKEGLISNYSYKISHLLTPSFRFQGFFGFCFCLFVFDGGHGYARILCPNEYEVMSLFCGTCNTHKATQAWYFLHLIQYTE